MRRERREKSPEKAQIHCREVLADAQVGNQKAIGAEFRFESMRGVRQAAVWRVLRGFNVAKHVSERRGIAAATVAAAGAAASVAIAEAADIRAVVLELHTRIDQLGAPGWETMLHEYGSAERCLTGYLQVTAHKGQLDASAAQELLLKTLAFREEHSLNRDSADVLRAVESARCRSFWPFGFAPNAPDGSPVEYCRLSRLHVPRILSSFDEDEVVHFFCLWCERALTLMASLHTLTLMASLMASLVASLVASLMASLVASNGF